MRQSETKAQSTGRRIRRRIAHAALAALSLIALLARPDAGSAQTLAALPGHPGATSIEASGTARPVNAWVEFCTRYAGECDVNPAEPALIGMTAQVMRALNSVNRQVNAAIKPKTDIEHWGVVDRWDLPGDGYGDCEDYQLLKRKILSEKYGLPRRAMRMTVVVDEQGEGHAVLMIRTDAGDIILDNKRNAILSWAETGYMFVKREGQSSRDWVSLGDRTSPVTTANR